MFVRNLSISILMSLGAAIACAQTAIQTEANVLSDGSAFLWVEAEAATLMSLDVDGVDLGITDPTSGVIKVSKSNPIQGIEVLDDGTEVVNGGLDILTADSNASGGEAVFLNLGGGGANTAVWQTQFAIPATYYLYLHYSMYNRDGNSNYLNEDSIYVPPDWNSNSRGSWIDYVGVDEFGDEKIGNSNRDGWMPLGKDVVSAGDIETNNAVEDEFWNGQFHWAIRRVAADMNENDVWQNDNGHGIQYEVADDQVGTVLDFQISTREPYGVIDGLLFSTSDLLLEDFTQEQMDEFFLNLGNVNVTGDFDTSGSLDLSDVNMLTAEVAAGTNNLDFNLNGDALVNSDDVTVWVKELRKTWFGDANLDGEFGSSDLVLVFQQGKFETGDAATWDQGDWNGDGVFGSGDLVRAFQDGGFEQGPVAAANVVPEPSSLVMICIAGLGLLRRRRRA